MAHVRGSTGPPQGAPGSQNGQNGLKWAILPQNGLKWPKMGYFTTKWPKMGYFTTKWAILLQNGLFYSKTGSRYSHPRVVGTAIHG